MHRNRFSSAASLSLLVSLAAVACGPSSSDDETPPPTGPSSDAGADGDASSTQLAPGEVCQPPDPSAWRLHWSPSTLVVAPGHARTAKIVVDPDLCDPASIEFEVDTSGVVAAPSPAAVDLRHPSVEQSFAGIAAGTAKITAKLPRGDGKYATAELLVDVRSDDLATCSGTVSGTVADGGALAGTGALAGASVGLQAGASKDEFNSYIWSVKPFDATIACGDDAKIDDAIALGPAVKFTPADPKNWSFPREIPITIPVNPARMPDAARLRHLQVSYSSPKFPTPRLIPVADPQLVKDGAQWKLRFLAPALGTFQAWVKKDAGTVVRKRKLTHRAVIGISMGGGGTAMMGARHHDLFDVMAPLGGPVDWTWMLHYIENNHLAGFPTNDGETAPTTTIDAKTLAAQDPPKYPYEHRQTFNQWWYEFPRDGNGGRFARGEYSQIFRDLALMFGNPNGQNDAPDAENLPAGVDPNSQAVVGEHPNRECAVWIDPIDTDPAAQYAKEKELESTCPKERCAHPLTLTDYYDDEYNPKGKWPVITVCDGSRVSGDDGASLTPYANTWTPDGNDSPLEVGLAVDYNENGVRDENEPIIRAGHEPWQDVGADGKASKDEPGYEPGVNEDPSGDDYHPQFNPNGTEGNDRFDPGEPYEDVGLDGVANTPAAGKKYDVGEGDGKFTVAKGLATFWERDSRSILHQWSTPPAGALDDAALARTDWWTDGGTRDLFNFEVDAQHLVGSLAGRGRPAAYYTSTANMPGQDGNPKNFIAGWIPWEDVPGAVLNRYGAIDPTTQDINGGSGQHVGTADEVARRLQSALYFIGSRWPDAPHTRNDTSINDPADGASNCEINGNCAITFTSSDGRTGPVQITLPPGYAHKDLQNQRYPVIYLLHGYGQGPNDLAAAIIFLANWMNGGVDSAASRLSKAILVYVDGRCRIGKTGVPECIRGTFFTDSVKKDGAKIESWWLELMKYVDDNYRTMPPSEVDWTE